MTLHEIHMNTPNEGVRTAALVRYTDMQIKLQPATEYWRSDRGTMIEVVRARGWRRLRGLIASQPPDRAWCLLLPRCSRVHGFGLSYAIDVLFLDRSLRALHVGRLRPWRLAACAGAAHTLELRDGECERLGIKPGDCFERQPTSEKGDGSRSAAKRPSQFASQP